jgi:pyruvate-ferredoxin/flavodoxin oxidoreductase
MKFRKLETWIMQTLKKCATMDAVKAFRDSSLNPEHPAMRGSHENGEYILPAP